MTKGYWSLATIAARWEVCEDTARERLSSCPGIRVGRAVRYSIEGVEKIEREMAFGPAAPREPKRRASSEIADREAALRKELGLR